MQNPTRQTSFVTLPVLDKTLEILKFVFKQTFWRKQPNPDFESANGFPELPAHATFAYRNQTELQSNLPLTHLCPK
jgi:hypothetical protein